MNMVLNIRGGQINFAHTNFNILINQYLFSSAVKALLGSQCHGNLYECYFLFWLTNISCTWHFGPIFLALCPLDLNFLHFTLWSYISCTLHFKPISLALFTLELYFLHFSLCNYITCTFDFGPIFLALYTLHLYFLHFALCSHSISTIV